MRKFSTFVLVLIFGIAMLVTTGCGQDSQKSSTKTSAGKTPRPDAPYITKRMEHAKANGVPEKYKGLTNPLTSDEEVLKKGHDLFISNCALCHGRTGWGDGPAGKAIDPKPSDLARIVEKDIATDAYLFWTVTEGGSELGTAMPAFATLSEEDRWTVILYLREKLQAR